MLQPSAASWRSVSNSFCTACGVSTDVGSSMISSCGFCSRQRTISTRWRSPTDSVCTSRADRPAGRSSADTSRMRAAGRAGAVPRRARARCSRRRSASRTARSAGTPCRCRARARAGLAIVHRLAVPADLAGVGLDDAVDDLHQRRLAGAVLAQHRVDLARQHRRGRRRRWRRPPGSLGDAAQRLSRGAAAVGAAPPGIPESIMARIIRVGAYFA